MRYIDDHHCWVVKVNWHYHPLVQRFVNSFVRVFVRRWVNELQPLGFRVFSRFDNYFTPEALHLEGKLDAPVSTSFVAISC